MDPTVVAACIAAGVSVLTLAAQYLGYRATSRDAVKTADEQRKQLDRIQAEQRDQLDKTLKAQSGQLDRTLAEQRTRTLNERFATAAEQLGSDKPAIRLAGVYAMAGLADDWEESRQTCIDVLCAYLRMPYEPDPGQEGPEAQRLDFQAIREVRHTVIRVITAHLREHAAVSWQGFNLDFTGIVFDGGDFRYAQFSGGTVSFSEAVFAGIPVSFAGAKFSGGEILFENTEFSSGVVDFSDARFSGGTVEFGAGLRSDVTVLFDSAEFSGGAVKVGGWFSDGEVLFSDTEFSGGTVEFSGLFLGSKVFFSGAKFSGTTINFDGAKFSGGTFDFCDAEFSGGEVDFSMVGDWSVPPKFPWTGTPPPGVKLPKQEDQSKT